MSVLSREDQQAVDALRSAVAETLERKRRLGQYAVIMRDNQIVRLEPGDPAPSTHAGTRNERCLRRRGPSA